MPDSVNRAGFLSSRAQEYFTDQQTFLAAITDSRDAVDYKGGLFVAGNFLHRAITRDVVNYVALYRQNLTETATWDTPEDATRMLANQAARAVREDTQHGIYLSLAELTCGALVVRGDEARINRTKELGRRIVVQRAHREAFYLADAAKAAQQYVPLYDEAVGKPLHVRAAESYGKNGLTPLYTTPKAEGRRFQRLIDQIRNADYSGIKEAIQVPAPSSSRLKRIAQAIKVSKPTRQLIRDATRPGLVDQALEEAFDMFYPKWDLGIKDDDVLFIARFASKVNRLLEGAGRRNLGIAEDPRARYMSVVTNELTSWNIPRQTAIFGDGITSAAAREPK